MVMDVKKRSSDKAAQQMIEQMAKAGRENAWDRLEQQQPQCGFGKQGISWRLRR
jgi:carbon-monoxide dehydrogenase catalytic subunit